MIAKRISDIVVATAVLVLLSPVLLVLAVLIKIDSAGPILYRGWRVGRYGREFQILRLRTMERGAHRKGPPITSLDDPRITPLGRRLRQARIDRIPELLNVLVGHMSLVGPLPEDPSYVLLYTEDQRRVLTVRPGVTGPAALAFSDEERMLALGGGGAEYVRSILPVKLDLDLAYVQRRSFLGDLGILVVAVSGALPRSLSRALLWTFVDGVVVLAAFSALQALLGPVVVPAGGLPVWTLPLIYVAANLGLGLHRRAWEQPVLSDLWALAGAVSIGTVVALGLDVTLRAGHGRARFIVVGGLLALAGFWVARASVGPLQAAVARVGGLHQGRVKVLVYGAGETGRLVAWRLLSGRDGSPNQVVGFIDDDRAKRGMRIHGATVLGSRNDLVALVREQGVELIVVAVPDRGDALRQILSVALETPARILLASHVLGRHMTPPNPLLREVRVEDLIGRAPLPVSEPVREWIRGKSILVTGACGSIGSELCRQLAAIGPRHMSVLDNNESGVYDLEIDLRTRYPGIELDVTVADVTDTVRIPRLMTEARPDLVFHVAAYKHVPLMERFPEEAVRVNVGGTANVLGAAREVGVERFVLVSTDKAVHPSSVMGMTKRVAEMMVMAPGAVEGRTVTTAVRFGNVLGSRGSVVPTFARQIELGGPVTVTHPEMTRYFMDIAEAATLIVEASSLTRGSEIFMLEMGERVRIVDIARRMIRQRGLRPDMDIPIRFTGVRPGEKLHEQLTHPEEERQATDHPLIHAVVGPQWTPWKVLEPSIGRLLELARSGDRQALRADLAALVGVVTVEAGAEAAGA